MDPRYDPVSARAPASGLPCGAPPHSESEYWGLVVLADGGAPTFSKTADRSFEVLTDAPITDSSALLARFIGAMAEARTIGDRLDALVHHLVDALRPHSWAIFVADAETYLAAIRASQPHSPADARVRRAYQGEVIVDEGRCDVPLRIAANRIGVLSLQGARCVARESLISIAQCIALAIDTDEQEQELRKLSILDEHTGLFNARHLRSTLASEILRSARYNHVFSLLFMDLDHFKQVNDLHGHLAGTAVLTEVGEVLKENIRKVDWAFRYGGDEFAVLLVESGRRAGLIVARRIRAVMEKHQFLKNDNRDVRLTTSIGQAVFPDDGGQVDQIIHAADLAMYQAKERGRNEVVTTQDIRPFL